MEFLNPAALFGFLALPLLLIPYLVNRKARRVIFSSLMLFTPEGKQTGSRPWGRIHLPPIFFLQLLLLALLILAVSEPVFSVRPTSIAIVMDNSASMQTLEGSKTRMNLAREKASALTAELGGAGTVDVYITTPRLERVTAAPVPPAEARGIITNIKSYDLGDPPVDYDQALGALARQRDYQRIYLLTDHRGASQSALTRLISVGESHPNLAVTAFDVRRSSLVNAQLEATATVSNFSNRGEKVKIVLKGDGTTLATHDLAIAAGSTATTTFEGFPAHTAYEVNIDRQDALPLDNRRFAVAPTARNLRILAITPRPQALASLRSIPGVNLDVISPAEYEKFTRGSYGLEIFHFAAPAVLPKTPALFILPPENNPLVELGAPISNIQVSSWREPHMLTRYINFSLFRPTYARPLKPKKPGDVIIESPSGALGLASEQEGVRYLALGFDPLPYLGRENLPMSIFTLNFLDWFFESGAMRSQGTGEPIALRGVQPGDFLTTPAGDIVSLKTGRDGFYETFEQGIYQRQRAGEHDVYARNLLDTKESDLREPAPIELHDTAKAAGASSALFRFWPYLLLASLLLFFVEWFISPRVSGFRFYRRAIHMASQ